MVSQVLLARPSVRGVCGGVWLLLGSIAAAFAADAPKTAKPAPNSNAACLECHSDNELAMRKAGKKVSLFVDDKLTEIGRAHV